MLNTYPSVLRRRVVIEKHILLRFETFSEIESALEEAFSSSAASVILYVSARKCGMRSCARIMKKTKIKEEMLSHLSEQKREENWGEMSFQDVNFERGSGKVLIDDSFETRVLRTNQSSCHFFRGFLAGFLSELFKKPLTVVEDKCVAKGDERCEFRFASSAALYAEEAIRMRDRMIKEMASKYTPER